MIREQRHDMPLAYTPWNPRRRRGAAKRHFTGV